MPPPHPLSPPSPPVVGFRARMRGSVSQSGRTLALVWKSSPGGTVALGMLTVLAAGLAPLVAYVGKLIIDAVIAAHAAAPGAARDLAVGRTVRFVLFELALVGAIALL